MYQKMAEQIKYGLDQVTPQLVSAAQTAHEENKRNFEAQERRISDLFGDMGKVISGLNDNLVRCIRSYGSVQSTQGGTDYHAEGTDYEFCEYLVR